MLTAAVSVTEGGQSAVGWRGRQLARPTPWDGSGVYDCALVAWAYSGCPLVKGSIPPFLTVPSRPEGRLLAKGRRAPTTGYPSPAQF